MIDPSPCREAFEKWYDQYAIDNHVYLHSAWLAWQAAWQSRAPQTVTSEEVSERSLVSYVADAFKESTKSVFGDELEYGYRIGFAQDIVRSLRAEYVITKRGK